MCFFYLILRCWRQTKLALLNETIWCEKCRILRLCMWCVKINRRYMISVILLLQCTVSPGTPFLSVCAVAAVWICYSLDALYTTQKNKSHSTCGTRQQLCHFTAHKKKIKKKKIIFLVLPSLSFSVIPFLSLFLSLTAFPS